MDLLLGSAPSARQPHAVIVVSGGTITSLWVRPSHREALETLRRWYAVRRTLYAIDEAGLESTMGTMRTMRTMGIDEAYGSDPATATVEEIAHWYSDGDSDYNVVIAPIEQSDPVELCLREEIPAYSEEYRSEVRQALLDATSELREAREKAGPTYEDL